MPDTTCVEKIQAVYEKRKLYERRIREQGEGQEGSEAAEEKTAEANEEKEK